MIPFFLLLISDSNDRDYMATLYTNHYDAMHYEARRILKSHDLAGDMVHEAFVRLIDKISILRSLDVVTLRSYVVTTSRNVTINYVNKRNRLSKWSFLDDGEAIANVASTDSSPEDNLLRQAEIRSLADGIKRIHTRDRAMLEMKYYMKLPDTEIAAEFDIKPDSVRYLLTLARRSLAANMEVEQR